MCELGEARAYFRSYVEDTYNATSKGGIFEYLPDNLKEFQAWQPSFRLVAGSGTSDVMVVFRPKPEAVPDNVKKWREEQSNLPRTWWTKILIPALHLLPAASRTRRFNTTAAFQATGTLPKYIKLYHEDLEQLEHNLAVASQTSPFKDDLSWHFMHAMFGQRQDLKEDEQLGPEAFGLGRMFDLSKVCRFCAHVAMNFVCLDPAYSLLWNRENTKHWSRFRSEFVSLPLRLTLRSLIDVGSGSGGGISSFPLFGLFELGNTIFYYPDNPNLEGAVGNHNVTYVVFYTPITKPLEELTPLRVRPYLLTYLLGRRYVSTKPKFRDVWNEVETERTRHVLLEACQPTVQLDAWLEVVITEDDPSFLASFNHKALARVVVVDRLLIKVNNGKRADLCLHGQYTI